MGLPGEHRHFTSPEVKTTPVEAGSDSLAGGQGMSTDVTDVLRSTDLLGSASAEDLEAISAASRSRTFRRGRSCSLLVTQATP